MRRSGGKGRPEREGQWAGRLHEGIQEGGMTTHISTHSEDNVR